MHEARQFRAEAFQVFRIAAGIDRAERTAMEGAGEGDEFDALLIALGPVILARRLEGALDRLGAGICEEDPVSEGAGTDLVGQLLASRHAEHVRQVPELLALLGERLNQFRVRMAKRIDGNAGDEVEILGALFGIEAHALASYEHFRWRCVDGHDVGARI
jgi:hypothetical protein